MQEQLNIHVITWETPKDDHFRILEENVHFSFEVSIYTGVGITVNNYYHKLIGKLAHKYMYM